MKVITIVGIRKSGKTSTVEKLITAIRGRGLSVGTCKTVFCPTFSIDKPSSNTARHMKAGSQMVCARAKHETALIIPQELPLTQILESYRNMDYVLLEGDYLAPVPRIVCAHLQADALLRQNELTICFCGQISNKPDIELPLPRFNPLTDVESLLDYIDTHVPEITISPELDLPLPPVAGVTDDGFCQCGCHHHEHKKRAENIQAFVDGKEITLTEEQRKLLRQWSQQKEK